LNSKRKLLITRREDVVFLAAKTLLTFFSILDTFATVEMASGFEASLNNSTVRNSSRRKSNAQKCEHKESNSFIRLYWADDCLQLLWWKDYGAGRSVTGNQSGSH